MEREQKKEGVWELTSVCKVFVVVLDLLLVLEVLVLDLGELHHDAGCGFWVVLLDRDDNSHGDMEGRIDVSTRR